MDGNIISRVQKKWRYLKYLQKRKKIKRFYSYKAYRLFSTLVFLVANKRKPLNTLHLIPYEEKSALGPVQRDEALLLFSLIRINRPATVLEIGFSEGLSAFNFLSAMDSDANLYSLDNSDSAKRMAAYMEKIDPRFTFIFKSQTEIEPEDFGEKDIDFLFIDASHNFKLNKTTFLKLNSYLSADAIIAIHDTGLWRREMMQPVHKDYISKREDTRWINQNLCAHQPGERMFVNWIRETYPEFNSIHLHSEKVLRHGITILQKEKYLEIPNDKLKKF